MKDDFVFNQTTPHVSQQTARRAMADLGYNVAANHPGVYPCPDVIVAKCAAFVRDGTFYDPVDERQFRAPTALKTKRVM